MTTKPPPTPRELVSVHRLAVLMRESKADYEERYESLVQAYSNAREAGSSWGEIAKAASDKKTEVSRHSVMQALKRAEER